MWLSYTGTGLIVCKSDSERRSKDASQRHGLLTTVAAVLALVKPHIHHSLTELYYALVHLSVSACMGVQGGHNRAKCAQIVSNPYDSESLQ